MKYGDYFISIEHNCEIDDRTFLEDKTALERVTKRKSVWLFFDLWQRW